ncbi:hypothetical protein SVIO_102280 [Streptomyces violaceusniger]|uniref:HTH cro/C1-type domain-containing protein n=2 Tax=Streptomyces violaceusniger TaxID=68280 RepID=A0A4D4LEX8_STRVO|nr:hypothetical protein SVIO_102280 [Streptomyces violaceusniger]
MDMRGASSRSCSGCGTDLSRYNPSGLCASCRRSSPKLSANFWASDAMREALGRWDVGALVLAYRRHTGVSQSAVAALVSIDQAEVSRLERGRKTVRDRRQVMTWTRALGVPDAMVPDLPIGEAIKGPESVIASLAGPHAYAINAPALSSNLEDLDLLVIKLQQRDNQFGGDALIVEAERRLHEIVAMLSAGDTVHEKPLQNAVAQLAQMAGWLALDAGRPAESRKNLTTALYAAHISENPGLASSVLGYMSLTALYHGSPVEALALARTAHDSSPVTGRTGAMLATRMARALAENGQKAETRAMLHAAERAFERTGAQSDSPVWLAYFDEGELLAQQGTCLMKTGALEEARDCLGSALEYLRASGTQNLRDQVHYLVRLADIGLMAGDLDESCAQASRALILNKQISSTRMSKNITDFMARLRPHRSARPVQQLFDQVP